jgi:hypothetical protein
MRLYSRLALVIQITIPRQFAAQSADSCLFVQKDQQPQSLMHDFTFGLDPGQPLSTFDKFVVKDDVGSH